MCEDRTQLNFADTVAAIRQSVLDSEWQALSKLEVLEKLRTL